MKIWGKEPAALIGLIEAAIALGVTFGLGWSADQVILTMAAVTAVGGAVTAWAVKDTLLAAVVGLAKAALLAGVGFGLDLDAGQVAAIVALVTIAGGLFVRTQTSPVPPAPLHVDLHDDRYAHP